jgi:hypothetical protein
LHDGVAPARPFARREHNEAILAGELGYTKRDLEVLHGKGVV